MPRLSVNIDHVATIRNARYRVEAGGEMSPLAEPDPVTAAREAEAGGADGITVHLREDRRHIRDDDVMRLREVVRVRFNLEMAATEEMVRIAAKVRPQTAMLVPEGRNEVTTEGGLDVAGQQARLKEIVKRLKDGGEASAFIDAEERQIEAAAACGFDICEVHTGPYAIACAIASHEETAARLAKVATAGRMIERVGMKFNAGHALNYDNVKAIAQLQGVAELHIGHAIVSRAAFSGLRQAVRDMQTAIQS